VQAIPATLQGSDLVALAPTGSGKTAAFVLPLIQRLLDHPTLEHESPRRLRALILAPTRELAVQIGAAIRGLAPPLRTVMAIGGLAINPQMMALRGGAHLVVATPGRLLDLIDHNALHLRDVVTVVLDEADRLLDLGFADELARILALLPAWRQTLMFSATMPAAVAELAGRVLKNPVRLDTRDHGDAAAAGIQQRAIRVDSGRRTALLRHLITVENWPRVLVFVATQYATEHVADKLRRAGVTAAALHGQLSPGRRSQALTDFQRGSLSVLVATDLAARGIDIVGLRVVVNHDLPRSATDHTHRIGRTGRAGAAGLAVSLICADVPGSESHFRLIEKRQGARVAREVVEGFEPAEQLPGARLPADGPLIGLDPHGGIKGRRKSKKDKLREAAAEAAAIVQRRPRPR
jgi:superfamily II DNA/RNA helicase